MKRTLIILMVSLFIAGAILLSILSRCIEGGKDYHLEWSEAHATGEHLFKGGEVQYSTLSWNANPEVHGDGLSFAIRLPDGSIVQLGQLTIELLDAQGAKILRQYEPNRARRQLEHEDGFINFYFGPNKCLDKIHIDSYPFLGVTAKSLESIHDSRDAPPVGLVNLDGSKKLSLPTTRDKLVEIFGEPVREYIVHETMEM